MAIHSDYAAVSVTGIGWGERGLYKSPQSVFLGTDSIYIPNSVKCTNMQGRLTILNALLYISRIYQWIKNKRSERKIKIFRVWRRVSNIKMSWSE